MANNWHKDYIVNQTKYFHTTRRAKDLTWLYPPFRKKVQQLLGLIEAAGLRMMIHETYRSKERQLQMYNKGASKIKTNGMHHYGMACDIVFKTPKGNPTWKGDWEKFGDIVRGVPGLSWGGDWKSYIDCPHVQGCPATVEAQNKIRNGEYPV